VSEPFTSSAELLSLPVLLDPYPFYRWLREKESVHWSEPLRTWMVTSHRHAVEALREPRLSSRIDIVSLEGLSRAAQSELKPLVDLQRQWMQQSDPPDHTHIRRPWTTVFAASAAQALEPEILEIARDIVQCGVHAGEFDIVAAFRSFPARVLARALGFDSRAMAMFRAWIDDYAEFRQHPNPNTGRRALDAIVSWRHAFAKILDSAEPRGPLDILLGIREQQGEEQLFATITSLVAGRHEPTVGIIGNGMLALLAHPDQHPGRLLDHFSVDAAVEEMLRYDCPFQSAVRRAKCDIELGGRTIREGDSVLVLLGAANRDPARFERAEVFDVTRADGGHLAFGAGIHSCLGVALARTLVRAAISALVEHLPRMRRMPRRPDWQFDLIGYRALRTLRVAIE
jgi:cytochrome P450